MFDEDHGSQMNLAHLRWAQRRATLPELWLEIGDQIAIDAADNDVWDVPNLYQFARSDSRTDRPTPGSTAESLNLSQTAGDWAVSLLTIHLAMATAWRSRWLSRGKPFKVIPLFVGPDASGSAVRLITHPDDYVGGAPSFFHFKGIEETYLYFSDAASFYGSYLDGEGLPREEVIATMDDLEKYGIITGEPANMAAALADGRSATEAVNVAGDSMVDWLATRTTDLDGAPLPAWNASYNRFHPENFEAIRQGAELDITSVAYAIETAIAAPFRDSFGETLRHGSWRMINASRAHPAVFRQEQYDYLRDGDFALGYSVPANYTDIPANPWRADGDVDADDRWETVSRTSAAYNVVPADQHEAAAEVNIELCRSIGAITGHKLFPSIVVNSFPGSIGDAAYTAARNHMLRWMVDAAERGNAERFWIHTPLYNTDATERARVADFVAAFNNRWIYGR
jgi:hypothetical protein